MYTNACYTNAFQIGCKVAKYSYKTNNCEHFAHLIKHGRLESTIENDLKKFYEESDPVNPKTNIMKDDCVERHEGKEYFQATLISQNDKFLKQFYKFVPAEGKNGPLFKIANYPHLVLHLREYIYDTYMSQSAPASKELHIKALLTEMKSLWCAEAIKIAVPKTTGRLFQCGKDRTHFNIVALVLRDVVKLAKLALKDFLDVITPMMDDSTPMINEWLKEHRKTSDNPMLYIKVADKLTSIHLYDVYEEKRCVEEKFFDKLWRSVEIENSPPSPYEIKVVHFNSLKGK